MELTAEMTSLSVNVSSGNAMIYKFRACWTHTWCSIKCNYRMAIIYSDWKYLVTSLWLEVSRLLLTLQEVLLAPLRLLLDGIEAGQLPPGPDLLPQTGPEHLPDLPLLASRWLGEGLLGQECLEVLEGGLLGYTDAWNRGNRIFSYNKVRNALVANRNVF